MKKRQKTNFVDDVKVAQPLRHSRTSEVDLINGTGVGEDLGLVQGTTLNAIGPGLKLFAPAKDPDLEPAGPTLPTSPISPISPTLPTEPTEPIIFAPITMPTSIVPQVDAGPPITITLPATSTNLEGSVSGTLITHRTWSLVSAPNGASPQIGSPNALKTDVSNLTVPGEYVFQLYAIRSGITGLPQSPTQFNNGSDTVTVTVLPQQSTESPTTPPAVLPPTSSEMPAPASNSTIDTWNCNQLNTYLDVYNQVLSDPTLTQSTRVSYENALLYINNRINTVCNPSITPTIDVPTEPTSETVPPLPTVTDINSMNCDQLNGLKTALVVNEAAYRTDPTTLQNYINTVNYVDLQFTQKCKNTTPTAPTVEIYAPGTTPYSTGVKTTGAAGIGGLGGGGGSSSKAAGQPKGQNYKTWWWIGVIVVVGALVLFKPGTKVGVPAK